MRKCIAANPLVTADIDRRAVHAVVTNSTYDGLCYDVERVEALLGDSVDRLHFDEAWYGYARFHPLYAGRFAMRGDPATRHADGPTLFATQSTHKLLAALSQASYIHIRDGRRPDRPRALQRGVHDACVDLAAIRDHRVERRRRSDDGRALGRGAHRRIDRRGRSPSGRRWRG